MELSLTTPDGTVMTPTPVQPDATAFAQMQDRMRSEANGETPADAPAAPPKRAEPAAAAEADKPKRGRPRKDAADKPRTTTAAAKAPAPAADVDYTKAAQGFVSSVWLVAAGIPPTQPYAALLDAQSEPLAAALAEGAKHSDGIRAWLTGSAEHSWKIQLASVGVSLGLGALQLARDPALREQARAVTKAQLDEMMPDTGQAQAPTAAPAS